MSESVSDRMREAGKVQTDPALVAIQQLQEGVATSFEVLEADLKKSDEKHAATANDIRKDIDKTRTEMVAGFKVHADKIDSVDRRQAALGIGSMRDVEGNCLAALGDEEKKDIVKIAWMQAGQKRRDDLPLLSNPVGATLIAHWLKTSMKIQKRLFGTREEESQLFAQLERYERALIDTFRYEKAAALTTGTDTLGGHWLPDPVASELYRLILDNSVFGPLATHVPMSTKTLDLPVEGSSALSVSWGSENTNITDSVPGSNALNKVTLTANRLNGFAASSLEEIQDSAVSILSWVQSKLTELAGREIDQEILEGVGSPFTGISGTSGVNEFTVGANGDALTYAFLVEQVFKARERASRQAARWFCAPELMAKIIGLADSTGQPVVQFGTVPGPMATSILGFPVEVHSVILANRTYGTGTGHSNLYFGPPSTIVIGDRVGMSWDVSDVPGFRDYSLHMRLVTRLALANAVPAAWSRHIQLKAV